MKKEIFNIFPTTIYVSEVENHSEIKKEFYKLYSKYDYNQKSFRDNDLDKDAFIIHFNYNTPWLKTGYMKKYEKWFLN